ncbi:MAG: asparagine synthase (glutamine-hydrolyzing) [Chlorobiaceae bacterium]|nr:asparagine synthase (glutamine-hydrolyzing) [Chlorobiaceae bacterium]
MCGIAGYYHSSGKNIEDSASILRMLNLQKHRGPDDSGIRAFHLRDARSKELSNTDPVTLDNRFDGVLGFNRLSILDLTKNGHQPMCSGDGLVILAFNGEIYNAFDFKDELIADGVRLKSTTDTEIVLNLYVKYGFDGMVQRLNGMFALVIVDLRQGKIFLARDRFGIKPMYLFQKQDYFAFSSEIKSLFALKEFKPELNTLLLDEYLLFRTTLNNTLLKQVRPLEPGTYAVYSSDKGFSTVRYFDVNDYHREVHSGNSLRNEKEKFKSALQASVQRQLVSDVKLGCQLSGGIDSSLVTCMAKESKHNDLLESVSIIFNEKHFSEEHYIDQVATLNGIKAHKFLLDGSSYMDALIDAAWHFDAPLNHPNTIGIYLLSKKSKKYVTVLLSGEGADEVFGGYERFAAMKHPYRLSSILSGLKRHRRNPLSFLSSYTDIAYRAVMASAYITPFMARSLRPEFSIQSAMEKRRSLYRTLSGSLFDRQVKYEMKSYLPDLLIRQDTMSMAHSIENRVPFLDNLLVDHAFSIQEKHLLFGQGKACETKYLMKSVAADIFGESFAFRKKMGFGIPLRSYFLDPKFNNWLYDDILPGMRQREMFQSKPVDDWVKNINAISSVELEALWIAVSFEVWMKQFQIQ